jgi:TolA-binding protein
MLDWFISLHKSKHLLAGVSVMAMLAALLVLPRNSTAKQSQQEQPSAFSSSFAQRSNEDAGAKLFRSGRNFIEEEKWQEAERSFKELFTNYPRHRDVEAALYWLAFALKKQNKLADADRTLERLIREHPESRWRDDAQAMRVEMAPQLGNQSVINQALEKGKGDDEMQLIALQSLMFTNPEQALLRLRDLLKPDSKARKQQKQTAIALLGQKSSAESIDLLIEVASQHPEKDLRRSALLWLGMSGDDRAFDFLKELVTKNSDKDLLQGALLAVGQSRNPRARPLLAELARSAPSSEARQAAILQLGMRNDEAGIDELLRLYDEEKELDVKKRILLALSLTGNARGQAKVMETARNDANAELRKTAIMWVAQRGGENAATMLMQMYDSEQDESVQEQLIFAMAQTHSKAALQKLMQIAKTSPSTALRKRAVFWLGQSRDPEAAKFIEEILK